MSFDRSAVEQNNHETEIPRTAPRWWKLLVEGGYAAKRPNRGDVYEATILSIGEHDILVTVDGKRDGMILERDLVNIDETYLETLEVGDRVPVRVVNIPLNRNAVIVSLQQGLESQDWIRAETLMAQEKVIEAEVVDTNRGGVLASFGRVQGFVPNSHLTSIPRGADREQRTRLKQELVGKDLSVAVIEVNTRRRRLILSERAAAGKRREEILQELHEGAICSGVVSNLVDFGAFVDLGGIDGLLHISEMSWDHVGHPQDVLNVGDEIEVYVLDVDRERERIALSRKRLLPDPWEQVTAELQRGDVIDGTVTHTTDFGAFVNIGQGVEGLVHISEVPGGEQMLTDLSPDTDVQVQVLYVDPLQQRISLKLEETTSSDVDA
jgi:small subunit ribosomal protein S1